MAKSIMQDEKRCYLTHSENIPLHKHHIYPGNPNRQISEENGFWVWLRPELHNMSNAGVHFDKELDLMLRKTCQAKYEAMGHSREDFVALIGKSYL